MSAGRVCDDGQDDGHDRFALPAVSDRALLRCLGYPPGASPGAEVERCAEAARRWYRARGRPRARTRRSAVVRVERDEVELAGGAVIVSPAVAGTFAAAGAREAVVVLVSAGRASEEEAGRLWQRDRSLESLLLDAYATAVVEALLEATRLSLCASAAARGMSVLAHQSPGYRGWDLAGQRTLLDLLGRDDGAGAATAATEAVELLPSGMLRPLKSHLALFGLAPQAEGLRRAGLLVACAGCAADPCGFRRAPFAGLPREAGGAAPSPAAGPTESPVPLYAFRPESLARWAREHLEIRELDALTLDCSFRYNGKTCGGLEFPFELRLKLRPTVRGHQVTGGACTLLGPGRQPSLGVCAFAARGGGFLHELEGCPWLGRTLDEALAWNPRVTPSGCLCEPADRDHKWRLVLQTVHYALARR